MTRRGVIGLLAVCASALAALPAGASAAPVDVISVPKLVRVDAGQSRSVSLRCPDSAVALNAAAASGLPAIDSVPAFTARKWSFRFEATSSARDVKTVLRCVRLLLPQGIAGVTLAVETRIEPVTDLAPGATQALPVSCSHGFVPTGWGLERSGTDNGLSVATALPGKRGWQFNVENTGATPATGTVYARCLERKQRADSGQRHSFSTRSTGARSCRASEYSVTTGLDIPTGGNIFLTGTAPDGRTGAEWHFANAGGAKVKTALICLSTTTQFR